MKKPSLLVVLALLAVYFIWGSTYLAMRLTVMVIPPLLMAGMRYLLAGGSLLVILLLLGRPLPTARQWLHGGMVGVLLLLGANGAVCVALTHGVSSGMSALVLAVTPLFMLIVGLFWGQRTSGREWLGILLGLSGIAILNAGTQLQTSPLAAGLLLLAAVSWSLGSVWSKHLDQAAGMMASAVQMVVGGLALLLAAGLDGEALHGMPPARTIAAFFYLVYVGAILGFSSYVYLLATVRPALAISYAYVNPVVAVVLGVLIGGEQVDARELWAMGVIISGVVLVCLPRRNSMVPAAEAEA